MLTYSVRIFAIAVGCLYCAAMTSAQSALDQSRRLVRRRFCAVNTWSPGLPAAQIAIRQ